MPPPKVVRPNADGSFGSPPGHAALASRRRASGPTALATQVSAPTEGLAAAASASLLFDDELGDADQTGGHAASAATGAYYGADADALDFDVSALLGDDGLGLDLLDEKVLDGSGDVLMDAGDSGQVTLADLAGSDDAAHVDALQSEQGSLEASAAPVETGPEPQASPAPDETGPEPDASPPASSQLAAESAAGDGADAQAATDARVQALLEAHPEGQRLGAELAAAAAGAAKAAQEAAACELQALAASRIKSMRERWEADAKAKRAKQAGYEARVGEVTAQLEALREELRASIG